MNKKKVFPRVALDVPKVEALRDDRGHVVVPLRAIPPASTVVRIEAKTTAIGNRNFDFAPWYGRGIDPITYACQRQIERFLATHDSDLSVATIGGYCTGLRAFLDYLLIRCVAQERNLNLDDIDRDVIDGFLGILRDSGTATVSQRNIYGHAKAVLAALGKRGIIRLITHGDEATFPQNPFPGCYRMAKGQAPLPKAQRNAFSAAVKSAVMPLMTDDVEVTSELLGYALLVVALHTGRNTTPLLELRTDCLRAHPKERTRFLVVYKRRGYKRSRVALRSDSRNIESTPSVRPTVVRLIERVAELTAPLQQEAADSLKGRLWLCRTRAPGHHGVTALSYGSLRVATKKLIRRFDLQDAQGKPLRINVSRLRKTFVNRINEILGDDLVSTAVAAGNTPPVTASSYLRPGENAQKNWRFMGTVLTSELLANTLGSTEKTPAGRCSDNKRGQFAPKRDGATCMNFLDCLRCRNYVVTGEDLYRLFSFCWRIYKERERMDKRKWESRYAHIPRLIDRDIIEPGIRKKAFTRAQVNAHREHARNNPHPYWKADGLLEALQ
jgi:hypothetical protein